MFSVEGPAPKWGVGMALGAKVLRIKFHFKMLPLMYRSQKCCMQIKSFDPHVLSCQKWITPYDLRIFVTTLVSKMDYSLEFELLGK
jgi:hypothetical protein